MRAGVILAGGRSTRFGEADKAVANLAGTPMVRRVADRLSTVIDALVINCRADQRDAIEAAMSEYPLTVSIAEDTNPDAGPMAGIYAGLDQLTTHSDATYAFVVACDMPFVDPGLVSYLFSIAETEETEAVVPKLADEWFQTTHAVYQTDRMANACERALSEGDRKILPALFELSYQVVSDAAIRTHGTTESFRNCNTIEEFRDAERQFLDS